MTYKPHPIDTRAVELPPHIAALMEQLAENTHENWSALRIAQGWTWGSERNDVRKEHPCLVAYDELPETEKQYDRAAAAETLKAILMLGYRIEK